MTADVGEHKNVQDQHPDVVEKLTKLLDRYVTQGRSTPGALQPNAGPIDIWKAGREAQRKGAGSKKTEQ